MTQLQMHAIQPANSNNDDKKPARETVVEHHSNELFFAVVGPAGAGGTRALKSLERACETADYDPKYIKASEVIEAWAFENNIDRIENPNKFDKVVELQDLGDKMRASDPASVAIGMVRKIAQLRAEAQEIPFTSGTAVKPDRKKRAFLLDSIRNPAEVFVLRKIYGKSFALIGVVCDEEEREKRLLGKFFTVPEQQEPDSVDKVKVMMARDAEDTQIKHGQQVEKAFFEADYFINNSQSDPDNGKMLLGDTCGRLIDIISGEKIVRPTIEETAMHHAHSARVRSACLSRQVGAALLDSEGTIISTGANEVPMAGGGVYGEKPALMNHDFRCAYKPNKEDRYCSSNREQNAIIDELIDAIPVLKETPENKLSELKSQIRGTRLGGLLEFSRAVHAEMDALLSASRSGISTIGTRLFVTTYPCHYCARHLVGAGVCEVQYIEPYPKSLARRLHEDSIETDINKWTSPDMAARRADQLEIKASPDGPLQNGASQDTLIGKVLVHPFVGVAPRLYLRAFEKMRGLKDKISGDLMISSPEWGDEWVSYTVSYPDLEAKLTR